MWFKTFPASAPSLLSLLRNTFQHLGTLRLQGGWPLCWSDTSPLFLQEDQGPRWGLRLAKASNGSKDRLAQPGRATPLVGATGQGPREHGVPGSTGFRCTPLSQRRSSRRSRWLCRDHLAEQRAAQDTTKRQIFNKQQTETHFPGLSPIHDYLLH